MDNELYMWIVLFQEPHERVSWMAIIAETAGEALDKFKEEKPDIPDELPKFISILPDDIIARYTNYKELLGKVALIVKDIEEKEEKKKDED